MITSIKAENIDAYKLLFAEASDILNGYKRVRTYDKDVNLYYYKNSEAKSAKDLFLPVVDKDGVTSAITSQESFANKLRNHKILYVKIGEPEEGFSPIPGITTLEEYFHWIKTLG